MDDIDTDGNTYKIWLFSLSGAFDLRTGQITHRKLNFHEYVERAKKKEATSTTQ